MDDKALAELEAAQFLDSLTQPPSLDDSLDQGREKKIIKRNNQIIDEVDEFMLERIRNKDPSLKGAELNSYKAEAFRQNQVLTGGDTVDSTKLIPTNINIQIINN